MNISPKHLCLVALAALLVPACGDSPTEVQGPPEVTFESIPLRPSTFPPFTATRTGQNLTMHGTITTPCAPFSTVGEAWHDEEIDALFVRFAFTSQEGCTTDGDASYRAQVTNAAGSARFRVIHEWPGTEVPPDTVFKAIFSID